MVSIVNSSKRMSTVRKGIARKIACTAQGRQRENQRMRMRIDLEVLNFVDHIIIQVQVIVSVGEGERKVERGAHCTYSH